ncbi:YdiY family protein [Sphingomonas hylomeconis]|uniref:YdiY family protein n=1 Tax=Sphingomonas hylomeconis TaxID=1395958 RepID=A0ABV7SYS6_9SPHN
MLLSPLLLANADIPGPVKAMLDAAIAAGNPSEVAIVEKYARSAAPDSADAISHIANSWRTERENARLAKLRAAGPWELWTGNAEVGGYLTTGNTDNIGVSGALNLQRETLRWRHKLRLAADYQESLGLVSREHYLAAYEPNFKFSPRGYVYGAAQYESDRFLGYYDRYSASLGAGYNAIKQDGVTLDVELGPAFRHTEFTDSTIESSMAARGSLDFDLKLSNAVSFSQDASAYVQRANSTVSSTTALNAKLIGPLAAKLSYSVQYESMPPIGRVSTDTTSRAALVYSF